MLRICEDLDVTDTRFPQIRPFTRAFAMEYKAFMNAHGVRGAHIAAALSRGEGYVSERVNGKRPLDTEDIDVLATLVDGWTGADLTIELARKAGKRVQEPATPGNVVKGSFGVGAPREDVEEVAAKTTLPHEEDTDDYTP